MNVTSLSEVRARRSRPGHWADQKPVELAAPEPVREEEFPLPPAVDLGMWAGVIALFTLGCCLGYALLTYLFKP